MFAERRAHADEHLVVGRLGLVELADLDDASGDPYRS